MDIWLVQLCLSTKKPRVHEFGNDDAQVVCPNENNSRQRKIVGNMSNINILPGKHAASKAAKYVCVRVFVLNIGIPNYNFLKIVHCKLSCQR